MEKDNTDNTYKYSYASTIKTIEIVGAAKGSGYDHDRVTMAKTWSSDIISAIEMQHVDYNHNNTHLKNENIKNSTNNANTPSTIIEFPNLTKLCFNNVTLNSYPSLLIVSINWSWGTFSVTTVKPFASRAATPDAAIPSFANTFILCCL